MGNGRNRLREIESNPIGTIVPLFYKEPTIQFVGSALQPRYRTYVSTTLRSGGSSPATGGPTSPADIEPSAIRIRAVDYDCCIVLVFLLFPDCWALDSSTSTSCMMWDRDSRILR